MRAIQLILGLCVLVFVGVAGWHLGSRLSSDAIGMALGVLIGTMGGMPAAIMVLAAKRRDGADQDRPSREGAYWRNMAQAQQRLLDHQSEQIQKARILIRQHGICIEAECDHNQRKLTGG